MKNLPTIDELLSFLKDNLKIIILSIVSCLILFACGIGYTVYTNNKINNTVQNTVEEENLLSDVDETIPLEEQLEPEEIELIVERLQEDGVEFSFYLEKETADPFKSPDLLKELLISPSILNFIQQETNTVIEPNPDLAVNVSLDSENLLLTVTIGTGDVEKNKTIADAYYQIISEESGSFFENKTVYIANEPEIIQTTNSESNIEENEVDSTLNDNGFSMNRMALLTVLAIILGAVIGVVISVAKSLLKKEVDEIYGFAIEDDDVILNLSNIKNNSTEEKSKQMVHSIIHPARRVKLTLTEEDLDEEIIAILEKQSDFYVEKNKLLLDKNDASILTAKSIIDIDPKISIDEVVFICKKGKTSKKWYEKQRKLLENYKVTIKVILV